jgi:hypothetical protein
MPESIGGLGWPGWLAAGHGAGGTGELKHVVARHR